MSGVDNRWYARSLLEVAQIEKKEKQYFEQMMEIQSIFESEPDFLKLLMTTSIGSEEKIIILEKVFSGRIEAYLLNFLMLITEKHHIGQILSLCVAFKEEYYAANGIVEVSAITAIPLREELTERLRKKMCDITGKSVVLQMSVDPDIIGGVVITVNNRRIDASLRARLAEISGQLLKTMR